MDYIISTAFDHKKRKLYLHNCKQCAKEFYAPKHHNRLYCTMLCFKEAIKKRVSLECENCHKIFERTVNRLKASKSKLYFCSRKCKDISQRIGGIKEIQPSHYSNGFASYRSIALRELGEKCIKCSYDKDKRMLDADHIDGNRKNGSLENLQILCVWCHALKTRKVDFHYQK